MNLSWRAEIYALMKDNGISRSDLASAAGVTPEYVSMVLNKRRDPAGAEATLKAAIQKAISLKGGQDHDEPQDHDHLRTLR